MKRFTFIMLAAVMLASCGSTKTATKEQSVSKTDSTATAQSQSTQKQATKEKTVTERVNTTATIQPSVLEAKANFDKPIILEDSAISVTILPGLPGEPGSVYAVRKPVTVPVQAERTTAAKETVSDVKTNDWASTATATENKHQAEATKEKRPTFASILTGLFLLLLLFIVCRYGAKYLFPA